MIYTVAWHHSAERGLASLWLDAQNRNAVAAAANSIDKLLRQDPLLCGKSRIGKNIRILIVPPLGIYYRVSELDRLVVVRSVWRTK